MIRFFCLLLVFLGFHLPAWAQTVPISHRTIVTGEVLRGRFTEERRLKDFNAPLRSTGHFVVAPGHGLIWSVETPFAITTVITPNGLIQEVDGNQTMNLPAKRLPFLLQLYDMLSGTLAGDWTALDKEFVITRSGTKAHWKVQLSPLKKDDLSMPFSAITAMGSNFVERVELNKADGDIDHLTFHNQKLSTSPLTEGESKMLASHP